MQGQLSISDKKISELTALTVTFQEQMASAESVQRQLQGQSDAAKETIAQQSAQMLQCTTSSSALTEAQALIASHESHISQLLQDVQNMQQSQQQQMEIILFSHPSTWIAHEAGSESQVVKRALPGMGGEMRPIYDQQEVRAAGQVFGSVAASMQVCG